MSEYFLVARNRFFCRRAGVVVEHKSIHTFAFSENPGISIGEGHHGTTQYINAINTVLGEFIKVVERSPSLTGTKR